MMDVCLAWSQTAWLSGPFSPTVFSQMIGYLICTTSINLTWCFGTHTSPRSHRVWDRTCHSLSPLLSPYPFSFLTASRQTRGVSIYIFIYLFRQLLAGSGCSQQPQQQSIWASCDWQQGRRWLSGKLAKRQGLIIIQLPLDKWEVIKDMLKSSETCVCVDLTGLKNWSCYSHLVSRGGQGQHLTSVSSESKAKTTMVTTRKYVVGDSFHFGCLI